MVNYIRDPLDVSGESCILGIVRPGLARPKLPDGETMERQMTIYANIDGKVVAVDDLVLCRSDTGDGGWSLHAPGSTDEQIASGDEPYLVSGPADWDEKTGDWSRPNYDDYQAAIKELRARQEATWRTK